VFPKKIFGEGQNIFPALAQRRNRQRNYMQTIEKISAELASFHLIAQ